MAKKTNKKTELVNIESENIKVTIRPYEDGNLLGFATITFYDDITIYNCCLMQTEKGNKKFIAFPNYKDKEGKYWSYCYIDKENDLAKELDELVNGIEELPFN